MDVRAELAACSRDRQGLATAADLRAVGVTRSTLSRALRDGAVTRVHRAVYAGQPLPGWPRHVVGEHGVAEEFVQRVRAALLALGDDATACATTAACLRGWSMLHEPVRRIEVVVPRGRRRRDRMTGLRLLQRRTVAREAWPVPAGEPLQVTAAETTVLDCVRGLPLRDAVVLCDSALRSGQVTLTALQDAARRMPGARHARRVRRVLALCDPQSGSVLESVLRCELVDAGVTGFGTQRVVHDARGRYVLRVDFCFEQQRLVVEADGARWHQDPVRDRRTDNRLAAAGWRVLRFSWSEVVHDPRAVVALVVVALESGSNDVQVAPVGLRSAA